MTTERTALLDENVLVALFDPRHIHHKAAHRWFAGSAAFATTPVTEAAFVRLVSNPNVGGETVSTALAALRSVRSMVGHVFIPDQVSLADPTIDLTTLVGYRQVTDFQLVNLAAEHGLVLATFDAKVARSLAKADRDHVVTVPA